MFVYGDVVMLKIGRYWPLKTVTVSSHLHMPVRLSLLHRMALFSFLLFRKNLGNLRGFFGQIVYRPPWQKIARTPMLVLMQTWACCCFSCATWASSEPFFHGFTARCLFGVVFLHKAKQSRWLWAISTHKSLPHQRTAHRRGSCDICGVCLFVLVCG